MSGIRSGRLRHTVIIQRPSGTEDALGQPDGNWVTLNTRRCGIEPLNGREFFAAQGENTSTTTRIRFRYEAGILKAGYRLVDNATSPATVYDIEGEPINPNNLNRELICMCKVRS